jgi:hypothetical protein
MKNERKKPSTGTDSKHRLPESQEPDGGRGAPQPATPNDKARAEEIVKGQRERRERRGQGNA